MTKTELVDKLKNDGLIETADFFEDTDEKALIQIVNEIKNSKLGSIGAILNYAAGLVEE